MENRELLRELTEFARNIRIQTLREIAELGFGHVGGSMSVADILAVLYGSVMRYDPSDPRMDDRDQLVLSKGHAGPALYATLALKGFFPLEKLKTLNKNGTDLPSHCDRNRTPGIDMTTGSLGQGLSAAVGIALAARIKKNGAYCYAILGDGECDEGQIWEAVLFAAQIRLSNLVAFVDYNHMQLDGSTESICDLGDLAAKFADFGWHAQDIDGHDHAAILAAIAGAKAQAARPSAIILQTRKGLGADFVERTPEASHHVTVTREQAEGAVAKLLAGKEA